MNKKANLEKDFIIIGISILLAIALVRTGILIKILTSTQELEFLGSFIAGIFFTSGFTTAVSVVTLGGIAQANSVFWTAFFGAMGAIIGDFILLKFMRDKFSEDLIYVLEHKSKKIRYQKLLKSRLFRVTTFFLGAIIIASPLPDELGISLIGFSKINSYAFAALSFIFNFLGIFSIGLISKSIM